MRRWSLVPPHWPIQTFIDLFEDSRADTGRPYLDMLFARGTATTPVSNSTFGGTATCDWLSKMASAAAEHPQAFRQRVCSRATPSRRAVDEVTLRSPQYYDLYTTDTEQAIGIFRAVGVHVLDEVGTPIDQSSVAG